MINKIENISIIMSVKNGEKFLGRAIESILNQTFINFEFIIVNNDSNDGTPNILQFYQKKDTRIKILKNSNNESLYEGRTTGINESKFDWFALMDADDECDINRIQEQVNFINNTSFENLGVVSTYGKYINYKNKIIANRFSGPTNIKAFEKINSKNESFSIIDPSIVVNKNIFFKVGGFPQYGKIKLRKDEIKKLYPNIKKIKKEINLSPKITFNKGITSTIKYYKDSFLI